MHLPRVPRSVWIGAAAIAILACWALYWNGRSARRAAILEVRPQEAARSLPDGEDVPVEAPLPPRRAEADTTGDPAPAPASDRDPAGSKVALKGPGIAVRLVWKSGLPCAEMKVQLFGAPTSPGDGTVRTDAEGRLHWTSDQLRRDFPQRSEIILELSAGKLGAGRLAPVVLDLPPNWAVSPCDLGTRIVTERAVVATGRVVDEAGNPIQGANVYTDQEIGGSLWMARALDTNAPIEFVPFLETDAEGSFCVYATLDPSVPVVLRVSHAGYLPHMTSGPEDPQTPMTIVLSLAAGITGELLLDEWIHPDRLEVALISESGEVIQIAGLFRGRFEASNFSPQTLDVVVRVKTGEELKRLSGVQTVAGEVLEVPALDVRHLLRKWTIALVGVDGKPIACEFALASAPDTPRPYGGLVRGADDQCRVVVVTAEQPPIDVLVWASGFRSKRLMLTAEQSELTVVLERPVPGEPGELPPTFVRPERR